MGAPIALLLFRAYEFRTRECATTPRHLSYTLVTWLFSLVPHYDVLN